MKITKAVIPAAGFGTRFLPQTKAMPKEMLPVVDKPVIQYVVEEAVSAGIQDVVLVTGWHKRAIEDHFDYPFELEKRLVEWGKEKMINELRHISDMANFIYIRQKGPYGNATPIKAAEHLMNEQPFLVLWGDDFMVAKPSRAQQLIEAYEKFEATILCGVITDNPADADRYAFVEGQDLGNGVWKVDRLIEKPGKGKAPSRMAVVSGYVLTPHIFPILKSQEPGKGGEYYLPEAIDILAKEHPVYAIEITNGKYYDTGNKLEYMKTVVDLAINHPEISHDFREYIKSLDL
jgi:UTP--glucose-1-phosphate uridylyltransferase